MERKRKEQHSIQYLKNERAFERKLNPLFITFEMVSFDKMEKKQKKKQKTQALNSSVQIHINVDLV